MSVSALPEWKQLLLERKRREEEERERREREEEERLANMPAWKRGIIQRRRAKQEEGERRDSEREGGQQSFDGYYDERILLKQMEAETHNQVSVETIGPVRQNPFIRSQNSYKRENRRRETDRENHGNEKERDKGIAYEKPSVEESTWEKCKDTEEQENQGQERDFFWRGRDRESRMERTRDRSEGRERAGAEAWKDRERDAAKGWKERDSCLSFVPGLRTIKAENIIIIEKEGKTGERETLRERVERDGEKLTEEEEKKGMRMELRGFLTSGGNVTEIRASEVLIIKPSITEKNGEGERGTERKTSKEGVTINETEKTREGEIGKDKEQDGVMKEAEAWPRSSMDLNDSVFNKEDGSLGSGRVSQILSKFGQHPKAPCRSKSTDCFMKPEKESFKDRHDYETEEERKEGTDTTGFRGVPKRSFSFSERVLCVCEERQVVERTYSDRRLPPPVKNNQFQSIGMSNKVQGRGKTEQQIVMQRKREIEGEMEKERKERGNFEAFDGAVFSVASVRNPEGIAFARRIPIRQDRRESKRFMEENERQRSTEREKLTEQNKETEAERQKICKEKLEKGRQTVFHVEEKAESVILSRDVLTEEVTVVTESVKTLCSYALDSHHSSNSHIVPEHKTGSQKSAMASLTKPLPAVRLKGDCALANFHKQENEPEQTILLHQKEEQQHQTGKMPETKESSYIEPKSVSNTPGGKEREQEKSNMWQDQEDLRSIGNTHIYRPAFLKRAEEADQSVLKSPKHQSWKAGVSQQEIRIPRSVFFGVDEMAQGCKLEDGQIGGEDKARGVERRESWKAGKPLTRVESLRERIRQRELERQSRGEAEGEGERETETGRSEGEGMERGEGERRREAEGALRAAVLNRQEVTSPQTLSLFDVTKEATVSKASPQLPASVPLSLLQPLSTGQEAQKLSGNSQQCSAQDDQEFRSQQDPDSVKKSETQDEGETRDDLLKEEYVCPSQSPSPPRSVSPAPSPPLQNSLAAMSRIYNLKTVGSRTAVCISERNSDVPTHSRKVFPDSRYITLSHSATQNSACPQDRTVRDDQPTPTTETSSVQRQVEQLQLRDQEVRHSSRGDRDDPQKETGGKVAQGQKKPETQTETQKPQVLANSRDSPSQPTGPRIQSKLPQPRSFTVNSRNIYSPENIQTTGPSTSSPTSPSSAALSPSLTPTPSRSSPLFSIRSASGGPGKRGTTITITPRRPAAGTPAPSASPASTGPPPINQPVSPSTTQTPELSNTGVSYKKRYPTVEEIVVIGGYQNLENSCLVKNRGAPKVGKVRFDSQLERVCEYPSEDSVLSSLLDAGEKERGSDEGRRVEGESDGADEEEDDEGGAFITRSVGTSTVPARVLRVDESCRR